MTNTEVRKAEKIYDDLHRGAVSGGVFVVDEQDKFTDESQKIIEYLIKHSNQKTEEEHGKPRYILKSNQ